MTVALPQGFPDFARRRTAIIFAPWNSRLLSRHALAFRRGGGSMAVRFLSALLLVSPMLVSGEEAAMKTYTYKTLAPKGDDLRLDVHRLPGDDVRLVVIFIHGGALMG